MNFAAPLPAFTIGVWLMLVLFVFLGFVRYFEIPYMAMMVELIDGPANAAYWTGIISAFVALSVHLRSRRQRRMEDTTAFPKQARGTVVT